MNEMHGRLDEYDVGLHGGIYMATDTERREVARRLRELHLGGGSKDLIERTLSDAIGAWRKSGMSWDFITERLADLIEPPMQCPHYCSDRHYCSIHDVPAIDREALLALADNLDSSASMLLKQNDLDPNRKRRGMRRDHAKSLMAASSRIREALGVK